MARYPIGQPIRISTTVRDASGTLVAPSTLTLTVRKPDGTTLTYASPTNGSLGTYHQDIPTADVPAAGHHQYTWLSTGTGAGVSVGSFDVFDPFDVAILSLQDAKDHLDIPGATTTHDSEIQSKLDTITAALERYTGGPIVTRSITERVEATAGGTALAVRQRPLVAVTSIVDVASGVATSITDLEIDANAGIIRRRLGWPFIIGLAYRVGPPVFTVTYTAGWGTAVPAAFGEAARIIIGHLWATQRGPSLRPGISGDDTTQVYGMGFAVPNRALQLLAPYTSEAYL
ncbi:hypothetical protein [Frankia sp. Cj3]|uniref:hypothetical protein n=1 Tax=Frankia sp. Cj3 TaxID=2880976 RepID=UPI001EF6B610|nr:hypothetical protein [Frankia sp. Cj3]